MNETLSVRGFCSTDFTNDINMRILCVMITGLEMRDFIVFGFLHAIAFSRNQMIGSVSRPSQQL